MKYYVIIFSMVLLGLLFANTAYAGHIKEPVPLEDMPCEFISNLEKSWIFFKERPWVRGSVINCDDGIELYKKDFVFIRILDINGDVVDDNWKPVHVISGSKYYKPEKYVFSQSVYRGGGMGNADVSGVDVVYIKPNQYYFKLPQIHSIDFENMGVYQLEIKYGNHTNTIWFATLDPDCEIKNVINPGSCLTPMDQY